MKHASDNISEVVDKRVRKNLQMCNAWANKRGFLLIGRKGKKSLVSLPTTEMELSYFAVQRIIPIFVDKETFPAVVKSNHVKDRC